MNAAVTEKTGTRKNISGFPLAEAKCKSWLNCSHHHLSSLFSPQLLSVRALPPTSPAIVSSVLIFPEALKHPSGWILTTKTIASCGHVCDSTSTLSLLHIKCQQWVSYSMAGPRPPLRQDGHHPRLLLHWSGTGAPGLDQSPLVLTDPTACPLGTLGAAWEVCFHVSPPPALSRVQIFLSGIKLDP